LYAGRTKQKLGDADNRNTSFPAEQRRMSMDTLISFVALLITSLIALFAALALDWLLLRGMFLLMQPATADRRVPVAMLERGTQLAARAHARTR
jgi:hypothetical protein